MLISFINTPKAGGKSGSPSLCPLPSLTGWRQSLQLVPLKPSTLRTLTASGSPTQWLGQDLKVDSLPDRRSQFYPHWDGNLDVQTGPNSPDAPPH